MAIVNELPVKRRLVWIVDDSPLEAERALKAVGGIFLTRLFSDGSTLLEKIVSEPMPDVLVLDWMMPDVTGIEVCAVLRRLEATQDLPILLLTSHSETAQIVEGLAAGANDYLVKPYASAELVARISSLIRAKLLREIAEGAEQQAAASALHKTELVNACVV